MKIKASVVIFLLSVMFVVPSFVSAQQGGGTIGNQQGGGTIGNQQGGGTVTNPGQGFAITNPLNVGSICGLIKQILSFILAIGGPIAALFLAYGGFLFISARGNPVKLTAAKTNMENVFLGIFIFMAAWLLGQVIANTLKNISPSNTQAINSCN